MGGAAKLATGRGKSVVKARANGVKESAKTAKREGFKAEHAAAPLHGEIICWTAGAGPHTHVAVVAALNAAGLNEKLARELAPRHAFTRAAKKLSDQRVIDPVNDDGKSIKFQFTKRFMDDAGGERGWKYERECYLELDKELGKVSCPANPDLERLAQEELDKATENRTAADVTKIVQKLFDAEADLFPVRDQGGVYFVPEPFRGFTDKVDAFLRALGGKAGRFPVPAGTARGDEAVRDAVAGGLAQLIRDHEAAVAAFGRDTRPATMEHQAAEVRRTRAKVEAYAHYLDAKKDELLQAADDAAAALRKRVEEISEDRKNNPGPPRPGGGKGTVLGHSATAVIRWMGKAGWGFKDARAVMDAFLGANEVADATLRAQLLGGRKCDKPEDPCFRGPAAPLTPEDEKEMERVRAGGVPAGKEGQEEAA